MNKISKRRIPIKTSPTLAATQVNRKTGINISNRYRCLAVVLMVDAFYKFLIGMSAVITILVQQKGHCAKPDNPVSKNKARKKLPYTKTLIIIPFQFGTGLEVRGGIRLSARPDPVSLLTALLNKKIL